MPIKNYTTTVPAAQSVAEIVGALAAHGATKIQQDYDAGRPVSIAFVIDTPAGLRAFRLPSSADRVKAVLLRQKVKTDDAQGFPPDYEIEVDCNGKAYPKKEQVARCGNAVPPPFATALARANAPEWCEDKPIKTMAEWLDHVAV